MPKPFKRPRSSRTNTTPGYQALEPRQVLAAPVAIDDAISLVQDSVHDLTYVTANDADADNDSLTVIAVTQPVNGSITLDSGTLAYTPSAGFVGSDQFSYTIADGNGGQDSAIVNLTLNAAVDIDAARAQILVGVGGTFPSPSQPGRMLVYGPTAFSILDAAGSDSTQSIFAGASLGQGRIVAGNDHQWLNMHNYGGDAGMSAFYKNSLAWLSRSDNGSAAALNARIVTVSADVAGWLTDQGYTNVVTANRNAVADSLVGADVLVGWLGNNLPTDQIAAVTDFVRDGGGLFISDYGIGYQWWWNRPVDQAPGNRIVGAAGLFFGTDLSYSSAPVAVQPSLGQMSATQIANIIEGTTVVDVGRNELAYNTFAKIVAQLPGENPVRARLNAAFAEHRLGQVTATPESPIRDTASKALLTAEASWLNGLPVDEIPAHPTAQAVYGEIPAGATRTSNQVFPIQVDRTGYIATGAYAVPGEIVTVTVPASLVGQGYRLRISGHKDNISSRDSWVRLPFGISRSYPIDAETVQIASAFGGTIYLEIPGQAAGQRPTIGDVGLSITGAIEAPTFVLGAMTNEQWLVERVKPAPYAELISDGVAMSVPSAWIRTLHNPTELMTYWNDIVDHMDWVGGVEDLRTGPERFNVDAQISAGLLHAGYPIQGPTWASEELVELDHLEAQGNWGYFHELGHEKQRHNILGHGYNSAWTFDGDTEVTVNIFANAALELKVPNTPTNGWGYSAYPDLVIERAASTISNAAAATFTDKDPYPFYFQLADGPWGWQGYRAVLSTYNEQYLNDRDALPQTDQDEKDQWLIRWSQTTGYDMTAYMVDHWKLEVSQEALDQVAAMNLPSWMPLAVDRFAINTTVVTGQAKPLELGTIGRAIDGVANLVSVSTPANGDLRDDGNGMWTYTPDPGFTGRDTITVILESSVGNRQSFEVAIETQQRGILSEVFTGISGTSISNLTGNAKFPGSPDRTELLTDFEAPVGIANNYGVRTRGYVTVPVSGTYTFWIASDDRGELYLSTDTNPANKALIASVSGFTQRNEFDKYPSQKSVAVRLEANTSYYIEALMKEGGGDDHLSVAWSSTDPEVAVVEIATPTVIESKYLTVFGVAEPNINGLHVTNTNDAGVGSLRAAIDYANLLPGAQEISFHLDTAGPHRITLQSALPEIRDPVSIDGTTQAGYVGVPLIEIDGSRVALPIAGVSVAASDSQISALSLTGFRGSGIRIAAAERVRITGNYLGIDTRGTDAGNGTGIRLQDADYNVLMDNVISGNDFAGVELRDSADDNLIANNRIGTTVAGDAAVANYVGVHNVARRNQILDNLIAGNTWAGVALVGPNTGGDSIVQGNLIGSNEQSRAIPNESLGVFVTSSRNQIGGAAPGDRNIISGNGNIGVLIRGNADNRVIGNRVGIGADGLALGNATTGVRVIGSRNVTVHQNVISANGTVGLFVGGVNSPNASVTENHIGISIDGRQGRGNGTLGVILNGAPDAIISGNTIAGNQRGGFYAVSGRTRFQFVGNRVGTDVTGQVKIINRNYGLYIQSDDNQIGTADQPNVITSDGIGVFLQGANNRFSSNALGTDLAGRVDFGMRMGAFILKGASGNQLTSNVFANVDIAIRNRDGGNGNSYLGNRIWNVGRFAIDNGISGIQANDPGDSDEGPNRMINRPEIARVWIANQQLNIRLAAATHLQDEYQFEFVLTDQRGRSSRAIGVRTFTAEQLSGETTIRLPADSLNHGEFYIAAYLTDADGNTSELSDPLAVEL